MKLFTVSLSIFGFRFGNDLTAMCYSPSRISLCRGTVSENRRLRIGQVAYFWLLQLTLMLITVVDSPSSNSIAVCSTLNLPALAIMLLTEESSCATASIFVVLV